MRLRSVITSLLGESHPTDSSDSATAVAAAAVQGAAMTIQEEAPGRFVIACTDQLGWQARVDLVEELQKAADGKSLSAIILDLDKVEFVNSAGLGAIFTLRKYAQQAGAQLIIARAPATILRLFRTVNLPALVPLANSLEDARARLTSNR